MFQHKDGRAATGHNDDNRGEMAGMSGTTDGTAFNGPAPKSIHHLGLKVQIGSSRDLALAALTSPVRSGPATPGSPAALNSPMPSMRMDSSGLFPSIQDDDLRGVSSGSGRGGSGRTVIGGSAHAGSLYMHGCAHFGSGGGAANDLHNSGVGAGHTTTQHSNSVHSGSYFNSSGGGGSIQPGSLLHCGNSSGGGGSIQPGSLLHCGNSAHAGSLDASGASFRSSSPSLLRAPGALSPQASEGPNAGVPSPFASPGVARMGSISASQHPPFALASSQSANLPAFKLAAAVQHLSPQKSFGAALPNPHHHAVSAVNGSSAAAQPMARGDSVEDMHTQQAMGATASGAHKVPTLPALNVPSSSRPTEQQSASVPSWLRTCSTAPVPEVEPEQCAEEGDDAGPTSLLLGMNPAIPAAMRRRRWSLDDFGVHKRMYKGATSAVYRAVCQRSGLTVALKVYFLSRVPVNVVHMIRREIELHLPLVHRNIIALYAAFQDDKHIVLVQEFAARGDLFGIHRAMNCRLTETQTTELVLAPFLDALAYLHARGIMHRDIKPENLLFTQEWALKIADFGVSINMHDERAVTRTGTADYMAPEVQLCPLKHAPNDNKDNLSLAYTPAIDIWSVGVLAYELLVGFPPFVANSSGGPEDGGAAVRPGVATFLAEQATRKTLRFPASTSASAKDFMMASLAENPGDRPTAQQLLKHPWLFKVTRRPSVNYSTSRFSNSSVVGAV